MAPIFSQVIDILFPDHRSFDFQKLHQLYQMAFFVRGLIITTYTFVQALDGKSDIEFAHIFFIIKENGDAGTGLSGLRKPLEARLDL